MSTGKADPAAQIVDRVIADIRFRADLDGVWESMDEERRELLRGTWLGIVSDVIKPLVTLAEESERLRDRVVLLADEERRWSLARESRLEARAEERARIRGELVNWLIGRVDPRDAGLVNGRRIVNEIDRICPRAGT